MVHLKFRSWAMHGVSRSSTVTCESVGSKMNGCEPSEAAKTLVYGVFFALFCICIGELMTSLAFCLWARVLWHVATTLHPLHALASQQRLSKRLQESCLQKPPVVHIWRSAVYNGSIVGQFCFRPILLERPRNMPRWLQRRKHCPLHGLFRSFDSRLFGRSL